MGKYLQVIILALILVCPLVLAVQLNKSNNIEDKGVLESAYVPEDNPITIRLRGEGFDKVALKIDDLPKMSSIAKGMYISPLSFSHAVLSPNKKKIAFSVNAQHEWTGILDLQTKEIKQLTFIGEGEAEKPVWASNSGYIAIENVPASGIRKIKVVDVETGTHMLENVFNRFHEQDIETFNPTWLKASKHILFASKDMNTKEKALWLLNLNNAEMSEVR